MQLSNRFLLDLEKCFGVDETKADKQPCPGLYFRYTENNYVTNNGTKFVVQKQISLLKKISCTGCDECGWVLDDARDGMYDRGDAHFEFDNSLRHGDIVTLEFVVDSRDWEMGYVDDSHLKVVKATPPLQNSSSQGLLLERG